MKIKQASFLLSSPNLKLCPETQVAEFALLGRSNVGKSSFINTLVNNKNLAKTSNTPGKTRLINLFEIATTLKPFIIADLPGYGYAKVSKTEQMQWQKNLEEYLLKRKNLVSCIQFIDSRHEIQKNDFQIHEWLKVNSVPNFTVLAKCDYISKNEAFKKAAQIKKYFGTEVLMFSSKNRTYADDFLSYLEKFL